MRKFNFYLNLIIKILLILPLYAGDNPLNSFLHKGCYQISFIQRNFFEGETETYRGFLIKNHILKIVYFTNPPFIIEMNNSTVKLGYKGEAFQVFDRKEYKNPILEVLYNLSDLSKYFKVVTKKGNFLILEPKNELKKYITDVKVKISDGVVKYLKAEDGGENYTEFYIEKIAPCRENLKLNSRNEK
jgi:hypothetical protein